jgi:hypothetical protein
MRTGRGLRSGTVLDGGLSGVSLKCWSEWALDEFLILVCRRECSYIDVYIDLDY